MTPRILVLSERRLETPKWQAPQYEFEDVIRVVDDIDLLAPPAVGLSRERRLVEKAMRKARVPAAPVEDRVAPVTVDREYDLFFAVFHWPRDARHLDRLRHWRARCRKAVCFIIELWSTEVEEARHELEAIGRWGFDHIFLFNPAPKDEIARITGVPTSFMGNGVDAWRFCPHPRPPERTIDFYAYGRRPAELHRAALRLANERGDFYVYDTVFNAPLPDYRAHRRMMAEHLKRTRFLFSFKTAQTLERASREEALAPRNFEASASGAVLLGSAPDVAEFDQCFPWPDATIPVAIDGSDLREVVQELEQDPERLARASRNNVLGALRRHDWGYRWQQVLDVAGLPADPRLQARVRDLQALAEDIDAEAAPALT